MISNIKSSYKFHIGDFISVDSSGEILKTEQGMMSIGVVVGCDYNLFKQHSYSVEHNTNSTGRQVVSTCYCTRCHILSLASDKCTLCKKVFEEEYTISINIFYKIYEKYAKNDTIYINKKELYKELLREK